MKTNVLIIIILSIFSSCKKAEVKKEVKNEDFETSTPELYLTYFRNVELTDSLKNMVHKGDTIAYENLKEIYYLSGYQKEFFFYSYYMAKNFNHYKAYNDCYYNLKYQKKDSSDIVLEKVTEYFLLKAYENKPHKLKGSIKEYYGNNNIPKSDSILKIK